MSPKNRITTAFGLFVAALSFGPACSDVDPAAAPPAKVWACVLPSGAASPEYLQEIGCNADFEALASEPLDTDLPGARSTKVVLDQADERRALLPEQRQVPDPLRVRLDAPLGQRPAHRAGALGVQHHRVLHARPPLPARRGDVLRGAEGMGARDRAVRHGVRGDDHDALQDRRERRRSSARSSTSTRRPRRSRPRRRSSALTSRSRRPTSSTRRSTTSRSRSATAIGQLRFEQGGRTSPTSTSRTRTSWSSTRCRTTSRSSRASSRRSSRRRSRTSTCSRRTATRRTWACARP